MKKSTTRRNFLKGAAAVTLAHSTAGVAQRLGAASAPEIMAAYVGTYTGAVGSGSNGEGIYLFQMDRRTGTLLHRELVAKTPNPSWIAIHPSKRFLYTVNEDASFAGNSGSVSAFAMDATSGQLRALNVKSSEGAGPAYLSIDATGKFAFVANYGGGSIAVLPILTDGTLGSAVDVHRDRGALGASRAADAPAGSFAVSGHDAPHAHMILPDPSNRFVLATDLGQDRLYVYRFDAETGKLTPNFGQPFVALPSGDGPRHFAFHPNGHWLYCIAEESSTIVLFHYDPARGVLEARQTISTLPVGFAGTSFASEILVSSDGRFLYAANRLHDSVGIFGIGAEGRLTRVGEASTLGDYPAQLRIAPGGRFLYACNRRSDAITCFRVDRKTGLLTFTNSYTAVGSPGSITFFG